MAKHCGVLGVVWEEKNNTLIWFEKLKRSFEKLKSSMKKFVFQGELYGICI